MRDVPGPPGMTSLHPSPSSPLQVPGLCAATGCPAREDGRTAFADALPGSDGGDRRRPVTGGAWGGSRRVRRATVRRTRAKLPPHDGASPVNLSRYGRSPLPPLSLGGARLPSKPRPGLQARRAEGVPLNDCEENPHTYVPAATSLRQSAAMPPQCRHGPGRLALIVDMSTVR